MSPRRHSNPESAVQFLGLALLTILPYLLVFLIGGAIGYRRGRGARSGSHSPEQPLPRRVSPLLPGDEREREQPPGLDTPLLYSLADALYQFYQDSALPSDLRSHPSFTEGVESLRRRGSTEELLDLYRGDNAILACMALEALATRDGDEPDALVRGIVPDLNTVAMWSRFFALEALARRVPAERRLVPEVLRRIDKTWDTRLGLQLLRNFLRARVEAGEKSGILPVPPDAAESQLKLVRTVLEGMEDSFAQQLLRELSAAQLARASAPDLEFLRSVGKIWPADPRGEDAPLSHPALEEVVARLRRPLLDGSPRSVLLAGPHGVGKTSAVRTLARELQEAGWTIFEASPGAVVAGQHFVGDIEKRVRELTRQLSGNRRVIWFVPEFHQSAFAGRHSQSPVSVLEMILPAVASGDLRILGECSEAGLDQLRKESPLAVRSFEICRMDPADEATVLELATRWWMGETESSPDGIRNAGHLPLREAVQLTRQFLGEGASPGNVFRVLRHLEGRLAEESRSRESLAMDDVLAALSHLTGLPAEILDERRTLDLGALRDLFSRQVKGQPEAVDCLVERMAMIKAGVTDPTRPLGVFLFAGPTGTGKTEIAKTLAEFLFGSRDRLIRIDMSELQTPDALRRLVGSEDRFAAERPLTQLVRSQPFSVVLLDEFEKAHRNVWDLFLQVFDDGRLTDALGNTADFRHTIIIMTSNLGSAVGGPGLGFTASKGEFTGAAVERAVEQAFRPEFRNRIDRAVVFRPLSRETLREILHKELEEVLLRRGLRNRDWAVEWDEGALEFLMDRGYTEQLGARPLKRAIERYFLSPLAMTIVDHRYPEGDQFLFVRADGDRLNVEFVDPNSPVPEDRPEAPVPGELTLRAVAGEPRGTREEVEFLRAVHRELGEMVAGEAWQQDRRTALEMTSAPGFWSSPERFEILGEVELMDRIEVGLGSPGSLLDRLTRGDGERRTYARDVVQRIALQLYLVSEATEARRARQPQEAFLLVEAGAGPGGGAAAERNAFARKLAAMYRAWGDARRMRIEMLGEVDGPGAPYRVVLAVGGFGAYRILAPESGLHVWELPGGDGRPAVRIQARVAVAGRPDEPPGQGETAHSQAERLLREGQDENPVIARRYREEPSPLVRDGVRGWRTGRLDRVLRGDFDLIVGPDGDDG